MTSAGEQPHRSRQVAESFGSDPERYDRARPRYPDALVARLAADAAGGRVLDVGTATGILARQLAAAGCAVLGIDPDPRLAAFARGTGIEVEAATFEAWEPDGRTFDAVVAAESWHWVDPVAGAAKAAAVLRPGGRLALVGNAGEPSSAAVAAAFQEVYRRVLPAPFAARLEPAALEAARAAARERAAEGIRGTGAFAEPETWRSAWAQRYTREEWLDALRTTGGGLDERLLAALLDGIGEAIEAAGGGFELAYVTSVVTAVRRA